MNRHTLTKDELIQEMAGLQARLGEAEETLRAIRAGEVDALVVYKEDGEQIFTLQGADHPYRVMVEALHEGAATLLEDGAVLYCNHHLAEMLEVRLELLLSNSLRRFVEPYDRVVFDALVEQGLAGNSKAEVTLVSAKGTRLPVLLSMNKAQIAGSRGLCLVATDLTLQKRIEELLTSKTLMDPILDQAGEAVLVIEPNGQILRASQAAALLAGQNPLFKPFEAVFHLCASGSPAAEDCFSLDEVLKGRNYRGVEMTLTRPPQSPSPESQEFWLQLSAASVKSMQEKVLGCIVILTDITTLKKAAAGLRETNEVLESRVAERTRQLYQANEGLLVENKERRQAEEAAHRNADRVEKLAEELEEALREEQAMRQQLVQAEKHTAISRMVASVAHEINNPLQTIQNCLFLLKSNGPLGLEAENFLEMANTETARIVRLVEQLRETYRPGNSNQTGIINIVDLLESVRKLLGTHLQHNGVVWLVGDITSNLFVQGSAEQIKHVFLNISMNAIEAMQPHGGELKVSVRPGLKDEVNIVFADSGPGIPTEIIAKLFEPFYTTKPTGTGLGLSICYEIVKAHGGDISVSSTIGYGATFTLKLPRCASPT